MTRIDKQRRSRQSLIKMDLAGIQTTKKSRRLKSAAAVEARSMPKKEVERPGGALPARCQNPVPLLNLAGLNSGEGALIGRDKVNGGISKTHGAVTRNRESPFDPNAFEKSYVE